MRKRQLRKAGDFKLSQEAPPPLFISESLLFEEVKERRKAVSCDNGHYPKWRISLFSGCPGRVCASAPRQSGGSANICPTPQGIPVHLSIGAQFSDAFILCRSVYKKPVCKTNPIKTIIISLSCMFKTDQGGKPRPEDGHKVRHTYHPLRPTRLRLTLAGRSLNSHLGGGLAFLVLFLQKAVILCKGYAALYPWNLSDGLTLKKIKNLFLGYLTAMQHSVETVHCFRLVYIFLIML
jgi:hypothetical protein